MMKYYQVKCHWCAKEFDQRCDTYKRQQNKYGHTCCKNCFGKEQSFKSARQAVMLTSNHFKGKSHSAETRALLSELRIGKPSWNKGLTVETDERVRKGIEAYRLSIKGRDYTGSNNPNWRNNAMANYKGVKFPTEKLRQWLKFRYSILERDCFKCYKCNEQFPGNLLDVHHLSSQKKYPDLIYDELNCIVLCEKCHKEFHKKFGKRSFEPYDTVKWLNENRNPNEYFINC